MTVGRRLADFPGEYMADSINTRVKRNRAKMEAQGLVPLRIEAWCDPAHKEQLKRRIAQLIAETTKPAQ